MKWLPLFAFLLAACSAVELSETQDEPEIQTVAVGGVTWTCYQYHDTCRCTH